MLPPEAAGELSANLESLGLPAALFAPLSLYADELMKHNRRYGLVQDASPLEIVRHLADSLAPWPVLDGKWRGSLVDLGSGAGMPGIPLALASAACGADVSWTLTERMQKRAMFLSGTLARLGLSGVRVFSEDAALLGPTADWAVCRAFMPLGQQLLDLAAKVLVPGGFLVYYAGKRSEAEKGLPEGYKNATEWLRLGLSAKERWVALIPNLKEPSAGRSY